MWRAKGEQESIAARRAKALDLRKTGATIREIAKALDVQVGTIHSDIKHELQALAAETHDLAAELRQLELEKLDKKEFFLWSKIQKGDTAAIGVSLNIQRRRAELLGLDAPTKVEFTSADISRATTEQLERIARGEDPGTVLGKPVSGIDDPGVAKA